MVGGEGGGNIVNTSSVSGPLGAGPTPYVASKHGVVRLTRKAAADYADDSIRTNAVCPGVINIAMTQNAGNPEALSIPGSLAV